MTDPAFSELHFFIDETGKLTNEDDTLNAVGGALFFGRYDSNIDGELKTILENGLSEVGGTYPDDLHFSQASLTHSDREQVCNKIGADLHLLFRHRPLQKVQGIAIRHRQSVFGPTGNLLLDENKRDNRYQSLLQALIEHLIFVDPAATDKLTDDWTLHLHIAQRRIPLDPSQTRERRAFEDRGYQVKPYRNNKPCPDAEKPDQYFVLNTLSERDLEQILRSTQMKYWGRDPIEIETIEISAINYHHGTSLAGLYLADLYLGQYRQKIVRNTAVDILSEFRDLSYGPWLESLSQLKLAIAGDNLEAYRNARGALREYFDQLNPHLKKLLESFEDQVFELRQQRPELMEEELTQAVDLVEVPGQANRAFYIAHRACQALANSNALTTRTKLLYLQTRQSHANHTGQMARADGVWKRFQQLVDAKGQPGPNLFGFHVEIRNRRAVTLIDQFRPDEAVEALLPLIEKQEQLAELVGHRDLARAIGACYGTLGQAEAFVGNLESAESFFRHALTYFDESADQQRQWIYLGHLACELPAAQGRALWAEALENIQRLSDLEDAVASGSQYLIAIYLKSCLVFSPPETLLRELQKWADTNLLGKFTAQDKSHHPFGLIYQTRAMCHDRLLRSDVDIDTDHHLKLALADYDHAIKQMDSGGPLLKLLAIAARLRRELLRIHIEPTTDHSRLGQIFKDFRTHAELHFGAHAWNEEEDGTTTGYFGRHDPGPGSWLERSEAILSAIRFNYW